MTDYFDILRDFETKKRSFKYKEADVITFRIPPTLKSFSESITRQSLGNIVMRSGYRNNVALKGHDKLRIDPSIWIKWFEGPVTHMLDHVKEILNMPTMRTVNDVVLVGGFAECQYVQDMVKIALPGKTIIVPPDAGLAVLKGAVRFGHDPTIVQYRVMTYTYGIETQDSFNESLHPRDSKVIIDGEEFASNLFSHFVRINDEVDVNHQVSKSFDCVGCHGSAITVFRTLNANPVFTHELGCERLGTAVVHCPVGRNRDMCVTFMFGDTELKVMVKVNQTGEEFHLTLDCL